MVVKQPKKKLILCPL